jgi:hypothetical protein
MFLGASNGFFGGTENSAPIAAISQHSSIEGHGLPMPVYPPEREVCDFFDPVSKYAIKKA